MNKITTKLTKMKELGLTSLCIVLITMYLVNCGSSTNSQSAENEQDSITDVENKKNIICRSML